jgi:hypothetical protein
MRLSMFGNGGDSDGQASAPETKSLWGDMFGLGPLMKVISDPSLGLHAQAMMQAIADGANASRRIEIKLNRLLEALGHDVAAVERSAAAQIGRTPPLLEGDGAVGDRRSAAASQPSDDGIGGDPPLMRGAASTDRMADRPVREGSS